MCPCDNACLHITHMHGSECTIRIGTMSVGVTRVRLHCRGVRLGGHPEMIPGVSTPSLGPQPTHTSGATGGSLLIIARCGCPWARLSCSPAGTAPAGFLGSRAWTAAATHATGSNSGHRACMPCHTQPPPVPSSRVMEWVCVMWHERRSGARSSGRRRYACLLAIGAHRVVHRLWIRGVPPWPRHDGCSRCRIPKP